MPLFGNKDKNVPPPQPVQNNRGSTGFFNRRRSSSPQQTTNTTTRSNNPFKRNEDASVSAARNRVNNAEAAEREADRALMNARAEVKAAREDVKRLEREAAEEYVLYDPSVICAFANAVTVLVVRIRS